MLHGTDWSLFVTLLRHLHFVSRVAGLRRSDACTLLLPSLLGTASLPDPALAHRRAAPTLVTLSLHPNPNPSPTGKEHSYNPYPEP